MEWNTTPRALMPHIHTHMRAQHFKARGAAYMPPIAIRTRAAPFLSSSSKSSSHTMAGNEHLEEPVLCTDALERDDPPDEPARKLLPLPSFAGLVRPLATAPSPSRRFRFPPVLGISHWSGSKMSDMDPLRPLKYLPSLAKFFSPQVSATPGTKTTQHTSRRVRIELD